MLFRGLIAAGVVAGLVVSLAGQQPPAPAPPQQPPAVTFRVQVNYVEIDAMVTDRDGRFVRGLTRDDFEILEDGRPQAVAAFSMVDIPVVRNEVLPAAAAAPIVEPDVATNARPFEGRVFLIVLDDLQTGLSRTIHVRKAARDFVERHVGANDLVAIAQTGTSAYNQDFTTSRARLLAAIERFAGRKLRSATAAKMEERSLGAEVTEDTDDPEDPLRASDALRSLGHLKVMCELLGGIRGRRKALVYLGEGVDYDMRAKVAIVGMGPARPDIARDLREMHEALQEVVSTATRNNVSLYAIDPRGLSTGTEEAIAMPGIAAATSKSTAPPAQAVSLLRQELSRSHDVLRTITEETGGAAFLNSNDPGPGLARIIEESSSYYILGYYAPEQRRDGRFRRIEVRVRRPGLQVRARKGYFAPRADSPATAAVPRGNVSRELFEAMQNPVPVSGLGFDVAAVPFKGRGSRASVAVIVELQPTRLAFAERNGRFSTDLELQLVAVEMASARKHASHHVAHLRLGRAAYEAVAREGVRVTRRIDLPPGRYRLQVGARDLTGGALGTVFSDLDVADLVRPPLQMSGLALSSAAATRAPTVNDDRELDAALPGAPTARREFPRNDTLALFCEIYDHAAPREGVTVRTSVSTPEGRLMFDNRTERSGGNARAHRLQIPLSGMPAGEYVLRVEAMRAGQAIGAARALRFTVGR